MCCCNCNYCITTYSFEYVSIVVLLEIESIEILWAKPGKKRGIFLDVLSELNMVCFFFLMVQAKTSALNFFGCCMT